MMNKWLGEGGGGSTSPLHHPHHHHAPYEGGGYASHLTGGGTTPNSYHGDTFVPAVVFNELQHEVSSLLVLKDALLETFPHLHQRITGIPQDGRRLGVHKSGDNEQLSDDITSSWTHTGSMPRHRKIRKSPEGSSTGSTVADSGFSTEKEKEISVITSSSHPHSSTTSSSHPHPHASPPQGVPGSGPGHNSGTKGTPPDVRWDGWTAQSGARQWPNSGSGPGPPHTTLSHNDRDTTIGGGDELMSLLEIIHRKAVKLRSQAGQDDEKSESRKSSGSSLAGLGPHQVAPGAARSAGNQSASSQQASPGSAAHQLGAIFEGSELGGDHRTRRRILSSSEDLQDKDVLMDRIIKLENETIRSRSQVVRLEGEIARVSRQKEMLEDQLRNAGLKDKDDHSLRANSEGPGGIIHSVQILTGGDSGKDGTAESARILSQSESNLRNTIGDGSVNIEIRQQDYNRQIGGAKSADMLNRLAASTSHLHPTRNMYRPHGGMNPSVSVVNLRSDSSSPIAGGRLMPGGSVDEVNRRGTLTPEGRYFQNRIVGPPNLAIGGRNGNSTANLSAITAPQLKRVLSNEMLAPKSRSVENLYAEGRMRSSNSEISLQPRALYPADSAIAGHGGVNSGHHNNPRMKGTKSEQVLTKIGKLEKVRLSESVVSMPAELAKNQQRLVVKPNRERFRQILSTSSVLELQRQLLTSVMENEVYKSQLSKITETWNDKIQDFEKVNTSLLTSLEKLRNDNEQLKLQMEAKNIELEGTKARLRQLEQSADAATVPPPSAYSGSRHALSSKSNTPEPDAGNGQRMLRSPGGHQGDVTSNLRRLSRSHSRNDIDLAGRVAADNYLKYPVLPLTQAEAARNNNGGGEQRVTFDLGPKKARMTEMSVAKRAIAIDRQATANTTSQLPSDARARLQEMAGNGGDIKRNYRKSSSHDPTAGGGNQPVRPSKLSVNNGLITSTTAAGNAKYMVSPPGTPTRTSTPGGGAGTPTRTTSPDNNGGGHVTSSRLTRRDSYRAVDNGDRRAINSAKNSLIMNLQNNNVKKVSGGGISSPTIRRGSRTRTPSIERSLTGGLNKDDNNSVAKDTSTQFYGPNPYSPTTYTPNTSNQSPRGGLGSPALLSSNSRLGSPGGRLLPAPPVLESKGLPATLTSMDIKHLKHDTIAELIAGILQKCAKNEEMKTASSPRPPTTLEDTESEGSSIRPQTAMRLIQPTCQPASRTSRTSSNPSISHSSINRTPTQSANPRSWEAFNLREEVTHSSHTATHQPQMNNSNPNYPQPAQAQSPPPLPHYKHHLMDPEDLIGQQDSLPLPDSLNEFEGEEYQDLNNDNHGNNDPDSLTSSRRQYTDAANIVLAEKETMYRQQTMLSPVPSPDSLNITDEDNNQSGSDDNRLVVSPSPKFFDSITLMDEKLAAGGQTANRPLTANRRNDPSPKQLRRIIPFADNSLSSGNSVFTSQDASLEDSKQSSSSLSGSKQMQVGHEPIYSNVTLNMRPLHLHPLDRPLSASRHNLHHLSNSPALSRYSISKDDILSPAVDRNSPTKTGAVIKQPNQTKDTVTSSPTPRESAVAMHEQQQATIPAQVQTPPPPPTTNANLKTGISLTEKLKWKFLGW